MESQRQELELRFEIVRVIDDDFLVDRFDRELPYLTGNGGGLTSGIYVVFWPGTVARPRFDGDARYVGPFPPSLIVEPLLYQCVEECVTEWRLSYAEQRQAVYAPQPLAH